MELAGIQQHYECVEALILIACVWTMFVVSVYIIFNHGNCVCFDKQYKYCLMCGNLTVFRT
mgnify:FL=1